ncbi:MAG: nitroreductase family protein [Alistipes sp.]|nr:nitroreductase family protein [Alistipes sp.]MDE7069716.1 nitroreductase family protein [Alistipes sp.]
MQLSIDTARCIRCGKCVKVCPGRIMTQSQAGAAIALQYPESCISCGHCVAVCPTGSVLHSHFPPEKVHAIDPAQLPAPEQLLLLCRARRSNRALSDSPVPHEALRQIVEAAHRAPTASNRQQVAFTVITDRAALDRLIRFTIDTFSGIVRKLEHPLVRPLLRRLKPELYAYLPAFHRLMREYTEGRDPILREAQALILIHTPRSNRFGAADANLAYQNGSLMAECLGVSQIYTGFLLSALARDRKGRFLRSFGIEGTVHAGMALGMPLFRFPRYIDKKPAQVREIPAQEK